MINDHWPISKAADEIGCERRTIQRWIAAKQLTKHADGVSMADVCRLAKRPMRGRPLGVRAARQSNNYLTTTEKRRLPFLNNVGLVRLKNALLWLAKDAVTEGQDGSFLDVLAQAQSRVVQLLSARGSKPKSSNRCPSCNALIEK